MSLRSVKTRFYCQYSNLSCQEIAIQLDFRYLVLTSHADKYLQLRHFIGREISGLVSQSFLNKLKFGKIEIIFIFQDIK